MGTAGAFHGPSAFFALLSALLIQVGTNFANDYSDFVQGTDTEKRIGPLRVTQAGLVTPEAMRRATGGVFAAAFVSGLYLVWRGGWPIFLIGVLSIISGIIYTAGRRSLANLGLADLFVLVFFGPVAVGGTYYVQALSVNAAVLLAGFGAGSLSVAILLANNIRDVEQDQAAGKTTLVVRFGRQFGVGLYSLTLIVAAAIPIVLVFVAGAHPAVLAASVATLLGYPLVRKLHGEPHAPALNPVLGATARLLLVYSVVFSAGWLLNSA